MVLLAIGLSGCSTELIKPEQPIQSSTIPLSASASVGQTFTAHYNGLQGIRIELESAALDEGEIVLHLRNSPFEVEDLRTARARTEKLDEMGSYIFRFPPITDSSRSDYFLTFQTNQQSQIHFKIGPANSYLYGALYQNGEPQEAQLNFSLVYDPILLLAGVILEILGWVWLVFLATLMFILPGWALFDMLWPKWQTLSWAEKLGLSSGLSVSIYPVFILWSSLVGLNLGPIYAWLPITLSAAYLIIQAWKRLKTTDYSTIKVFSLFRAITYFDLILIVIIGFVLTSRFWVLRNIDLPLWGDGYQHALITQLMVDHKGLFDSWLPYAELSTFTYHFGFHSGSAIFHWVSGLDIPKSVLYTGQIFNLLAVIGLYPLSMRLTHNRLAAASTILIAGLLFPMPMFYLNWGRYTQLAGQVILPTLIFMNWSLLESPKFDKRLIFLSGLTYGSLALTHYRVLILALAFLPAWFVLKYSSQKFSLQMSKVVSMGTLGILLFLPWLIHTFSGNLTDITSGQLSAPASAAANFAIFPSELSKYLPSIAWISLPLIICWGLWRREHNLAVLLTWWAVILVLTNPQWFGLSGSGIISNFAIFIAAYIPASLFIGSALGWLAEFAQAKFPIPSQVKYPFVQSAIHASTLILVFVICLYGAKTRLGDAQIAQHILTTRPDLRASVWIQENLSDQARILVNSFLAYNGTASVGSDGGWWLPYTAHRLTTQPPLNYVSEQGIQPDFQKRTNELTEMIEHHGVNHPDVLLMLQERGVTHVYIGQMNGSVNSGGKHLDVQQILDSIHFTPVYHQDQVWIFEFQP